MQLVRDIMTRDVSSVTPTTTIEQIATLMRDCDIGALPVIEDDAIVGIITDRDIVVRGVAHDRSGSMTRAADMMTKDVECCDELDDVEIAVAKMAERQVRRLPVRDAQGQLSGIISLSDLALSIEDAASFALGEVSEPTLAQSHSPANGAAAYS